jgi:uncharacterized membrane protein
MINDSDVPVEVIVATFTRENGAKEALDQLTEVKKDGLIDIQNAAVLRKDEEGKIHIKETADMSGRRGAGVGGVIGGVVGLIFPPSILATAAVGAAVGGLSAKLRDSGFQDERLRRVADGLQPNTSALIAVIEHTWVLKVEEQLREYGADVITEALRADIAAQLEEAADSGKKLDAASPVSAPVEASGEPHVPSTPGESEAHPA